LLALVDARANAPEKQQEVLALVIDRETSAEVSRINTEIGRSIYYHTPRHRMYRLSDQKRLWDEFGKSYDQERATTLLGKDASYENLLIEYTQLKLYLHDLRKSCYYRGDPYCEREDIDVKGILDRCDELRWKIKEKRRVIRYAAWGGMEPQKSTAYDKPLLYAFDEYTCSHIVNGETIASENEEPTVTCPLKGEHWYHGNPYCRAHLGEARRSFKMAKRRNERCCDRRYSHTHEFGGIER
jgi:hypothetical protein